MRTLNYHSGAINNGTMADKILKKLNIEVWRQNNAKSKGKFETYTIENISTGTSFLEMLDILNNDLTEKGIDPIAFDHDCREGICGTCSLYINGRPHGPDSAVTTCQLHMRKFKEGETITIEPWRAKAFPVIRIWWSTDQPSSRSSRPEVSYRLTRVVYPTGTPSSSVMKMPKKPWMQPPASAAALVWRHAKTRRPCFSFPQKYPTWPNCPREGWKPNEGHATWWLKWMNWDSADAPIPRPVKRNAPRASPFPTSHGLTGNTWRHASQSSLCHSKPQRDERRHKDH